MHFHVHGKRSKIRYVPVHPEALTRIHDYLGVSGHALEQDTPLFRPVRNHMTGTLVKHMNTSSVFRLVRKYGVEVGISALPFSPHSLRATSATNALEHSADIAKVQQWLGHANVSTTKLYDRRKSRPEESPTFQVKY
jgi:integrase